MNRDDTVVLVGSLANDRCRGGDRAVRRAAAELLVGVGKTSETGGGGVAAFDTTTGALVNAGLVNGTKNPTSIAVSGGNIFVLDVANTNGGGPGISEYTASGTLVNPRSSR